MNAPIERLLWQEATVARIVEETPTVKSYFLHIPSWRGFMAGQHVDVRLTAPDGYQAQRSYSIGSAPGAPEVELVIEKLDTGEVSPFFHDVVQQGDDIEVRGPIGGHFTWDKDDGGPLLLVGGGSGVVPMMSMLRHRADVAPEVPAVLIYSVRHVGDIIFRDELMRRAASDPNLAVIVTVTRETPDDKRLRAVARDIHDLATRARTKQLSADDITGGTFTISNSGPFGTFMVIPVINQPQVAILSTDGVSRKPVVVTAADGTEAIAIHSVGMLAMSWDHRAFDGAYAAAFLREVKSILETRDWEAEIS